MPGGASGLTTVGKLEGQHTALMQVQLVLVGLGVVQDLHVAALHAHGQPLPSGAVTQGEDLQGQTVQCPLCPQGWSSPLGRVRSSPYRHHLQTEPDNQNVCCPSLLPQGCHLEPIEEAGSGCG